MDGVILSSMQLSEDRFRALARSSPWRWRTVQLTARWSDRAWTARAWVRRPNGLRVEDIDGTLRQASVQEPKGSAWLSRGGRGRTAPLPWIGDLAVVRDGDGLVSERPREMSEHDPMYRDYQWVAMLDPVELADGERDVDIPPVTLERLAEVEHHGRRAWEAVLHPTEVYAPRCSCCPLLHSEISDALDARGGDTTALQHEPGFRYPDAHRVRLDVETSVCVLVEAIGGSEAGVKAEFALEKVDVPMSDELFRVKTGARKGLRRRLR